MCIVLKKCLIFWELWLWSWSSQNDRSPISEDYEYDRSSHKMHYLWELWSWSHSSQKCHFPESLCDCNHDTSLFY